MKINKTFLKKLKSDTIETLKSLTEEEVAQLIQESNYSYYNEDDPIMSDNLYDIVKEYMENLNPNHPILSAVGAPIGDFEKVPLPYWAGSMDKIKADAKVLERWHEKYKGEFYVSDKLDGISGVLVKDGEDIKLYTRGSGSDGKDVSHMIPFINYIPKFKKVKKTKIAVRGELIIPPSKIKLIKPYIKKLKDIDDSELENDRDKFSDLLRNIVSGVFNSKKPDLELAKHIDFVTYECIEPPSKPEKQFKILEKMKFKVVHYTKIDDSNINIEYLSEILVDRRKNSEYICDGIIINHNKKYPQITSGNPKHAFAFKSIITQKKAEVIVTKVEWNPSKDGYLKPIVHYQPINVGGVTLQKATGYNGKFIEENKIGPGSKIIIIRSGDVIPKIINIMSSGDDGASMPDIEYEWNETHVDISIKKPTLTSASTSSTSKQKMCSCPCPETDKNESVNTVKNEMMEQYLFKQIEYFFTKMDIKGIGEGLIKKIYNKGYRSINEILNINKEKLLEIEGVKEKTALKILDGMKKIREAENCIKYMVASNTFGRGFGTRKLKTILDSNPKIVNEDYTPSIDEMIKIEGIQTKTAKNFIDNLEEYRNFMKENDLKCSYTKQKIKISKNSSKSLLYEKNIVFTGFRDKDLNNKIEELGGKIKTSLSKSADILLVKDKETSKGKIDKALKLNEKIEIIDKEEFIEKYFQ